MFNPLITEVMLILHLSIPQQLTKNRPIFTFNPLTAWEDADVVPMPRLHLQPPPVF